MPKLTLVSFADDIRPLFRPIDVNHMLPFGVRLADFEYMSDATDDHGNAKAVLARLKGEGGGRMPPGGPFWTPDMLALFEKWMSDGFRP